MKNLYIAGSLFNEAEVNQRIKEGNMKRLRTNSIILKNSI